MSLKLGLINFMKKVIIFIFYILLIFIVVPLTVQATQWGAEFTFTCIVEPDNRPGDCNTGEQQLKLVVLAPPDTVYDIRFTFLNTGPKDSSITGVFFDDPTIASPSTESYPPMPGHA